MKRLVRLLKKQQLPSVEQFGIEINESFFPGGKRLALNDSRGDVYYEGINMFFEVKVAGESSGAILVKSQVRRHTKDLATCSRNYILVFHDNRHRHPETGKYVYHTLKAAKTQEELARHLNQHVQSIYVVDARAVKALYRYWKAKGHEKTHRMSGGHIKVYLKVRPNNLVGSKITPIPPFVAKRCHVVRVPLSVVCGDRLRPIEIVFVQLKREGPWKLPSCVGVTAIAANSQHFKEKEGLVF